MSGEDIYSSEPRRHERNGGMRTMSESTRMMSVAEDSLDAILSRLTRGLGAGRFSFLLKEPFPIPNCFDSEDRQVIYWPDAIVHGSVFGDGIFRVQGGIHRTRKHQLRDPIQKERMEGVGYWVEDLSDSEARQEPVVRERLELHRRKVDSYGGAL